MRSKTHFSRLPFVWLISLRFLREGRLQTVLILGGIAAGVAITIFLSELMAQLEKSMVERVLGSQAHVIIQPLDEQNRLILNTNQSTSIVEPRASRLKAINQWEQVVALAEKLPAVRVVSPLVSGPAFVIRSRANRSVVIMGVEPKRYQNIVPLGRYMLSGAFELSSNHAIIGTDLADDLGASVGDKIYLRTAQGHDELLQITGVFDIGIRDLNSRWVFTSMKMAQNLLDLKGGASSLDITITDIFEAKQVAKKLAALTGLTTKNWMDSNAQLQRAIRSQASASDLIRFFIALVVALGIASVLTISVVQKQKEIGILRAMGASAMRIKIAFLLQGALLGLFGSILGGAIAWVMIDVAKAFVAPDNILSHAELPFDVAMATAALATLVGLVAAWLPARQAAKMEPSTAIKT